MREIYLSVSDFWSAALWRGAWQICVAVALACAIEAGWRNMPQSWRSWMWRLVFVKLLVAALLPLAIPLPVLPAPAGASARPSAPVARTIAAAGPAREAERLPAEKVVPNSAAASPAALSWSQLLFALWATVASVQLAWTVRDCLWIRRQLRLGRPLTYPFIRRMLAAQFPGVRQPQLLAADGIDSPCLAGGIGFGKQTAILLPSAWLRSCTQNQLRLAVAHEMAHWVRGDLAWNWLVVLGRTLFFFHPLVWLATRRYQAAQELACDALALERSGGSPVELAHLLLQFAAQPNHRRWAGVAAVTGAAAALHERIVAMQCVRQPVPRRWTVALAGGCLLLALAPFSLAQKPTVKPASKVAEGATDAPKTPAKPKASAGGASASAFAKAGGFAGGFANGGGDANGFGKAFGAAQAQAAAEAFAQIGEAGKPQPEAKKPAAKPAFKSPGESAPAAKAPKTSKQSRSRSSSSSSTNQDGVKSFSRTTETADDERKLKFVETDGEIRVTTKDLATGKETTVVAKDAAELEKLHPAAFELFREHVLKKIELPEGIKLPEGFKLPEGIELPEGFQLPKGILPEGIDLQDENGPNAAQELLREQLKRLRGEDNVRGTPLEKLLEDAERALDEAK